MAPKPDSRESQFRQAIALYGPALQRLVRGYEAEATLQEELRQELLLALWRALPSFRGDSSMRTFVFRVAHNTAIKHVHRGARQRKASEWGLEPAPTESASEEVLDRIRQRRMLASAIRALPDLDREVMLLHLEGLPNREVAEVTGLSVSNTGTRLARIRARLLKQLGGSP